MELDLCHTVRVSLPNKKTTPFTKEHSYIGSNPRPLYNGGYNYLVKTPYVENNECTYVLSHTGGDVSRTFRL